MPATGAVTPPTPQTMAAAQINPAAAATPAAQAAVNTTQAKAQKSQWGASANYDINSGAGNVKIQTPAGPMNVKFNSKGQPEPIIEPQTAPPIQTAGAVAPSGPSYNVPTQTVPQVKPFFRPMPAQTKINMPEQGPATPMPMQPYQTPVPKTATQAVAEFNRAKQAKQLANQQRIEKMTWEAVQQRVANGGKIMPNEQTMINDIVKKYGDDPFGTGKINSDTASAPIETTPSKQRDLSVGKADKQFTKDLEDVIANKKLSAEEAFKAIDDAMKKYEGVTARKQLRVYEEAYDAAIAAGKDEIAATQAGNKALKAAQLPKLSGDKAQTRMKPKESNIMETKMAQDWYDNLIKNAPDKTTKDMYKQLLENNNGDVAQLYRDMSGKPTGKSGFE